MLRDCRSRAMSHTSCGLSEPLTQQVVGREEALASTSNCQQLQLRQNSRYCNQLIEAARESKHRRNPNRKSITTSIYPQVKQKSRFKLATSFIISVFVIILLTTIVPTFLNIVDCFQVTSQQPIISRRQESLSLSPFYHEAITSSLPSTNDWAQRLPGQSFSGPLVAPSVSPQALNLANLIASHRSHSSIPGFVANQGQRILRSLANKTTNALNDLAVARQILASDNIQIQPQLTTTNRPLQVLATNGLQTNHQRLFPKMNKLVNYLFPNNTNISGQVEAKLEDQQGKLIATTVDLLSSSSGASGGSLFSRTSHLRPTVSEEPVSEKSSVSLSLGAPYEPRPRLRQLVGPSLGLNGKGSHGNDSQWSDLRTSAQTNILYPDLEPDAEQSLEYANMANETSQLTAEENQMQQETDQTQFTQQNGNDTDSRFMSNDQALGSQYIDQSDGLNGTNNDTSNSEGHQSNELSGSADEIHQQQAPDESPFNNDPGTGYQGPSNEGAFDEMTNFTSMEGANQQNAQELSSTHATLKPSHSSATGGQASDEESILAAQLPSQYDAVLRLPPDGYYDDYFKPANSDLIPQSPITMASLFPDATSEFTLTPTGDYPPLHRSTNNRTTSDHHDSKFLTPGIDYMAQYYLHQQPLKQQASPIGGDHSMEFITPNISMVQVGERKQKSIGDASLNNYKHETGDSPVVTNGTKLAVDERDQQGERQIMITGNVDGSDPRRRENSTSNDGNHQLEDSIQVILANTANNSRDPRSNEKVISYTSEGRNTTLTAGKPPRSTFVNRDMNEFPAIESSTTTTSPRNEEQTGSTEMPVFGGKQFANNHYPHSHETTRGHHNAQVATNNNDIDDHEDNVGRLEKQPNLGPESEDELLRVTIGGANGYGEYKAGGPRVDESEEDSEQQGQSKRAHKSELQSSSPNDRSSGRSMMPAGNYKGNMSGNYNNQRDKRFRQEKSPPNPMGGRTTSRPRRNSNPNGNGNNIRHNHHHHHHQQTIQRPQVSEVHFNPKDLILHSPTPVPTVADTIVDLPARAKKIHNDPPDKNELMNELLTALDRVKAAIYKLQPLTAKMNAIYRKSVTSNTRDIIMDHHKGTYAKRYPPGDYDDAYDRMHPSELIQRGISRSSGSTNQSNSRARRSGRTSGRDMESSDSMERPVYLPAPASLNKSYLADTQKLHHASGDGLNSSESQLVATAVGRRLGDGQIVGQLSLTSDPRANLVFDDNHQDSSNRDASSDDNSPVSSSSQNSKKVFNPNATLDSAAPNFMPLEQLAERDSSSFSSESPLFGYRITIFQAPDSDEADGITLENGDNYAYDLEDNSGKSIDSVTELPAQEDLITSESSDVESPMRLAPNATAQSTMGDDETLEGSESKYKKKKQAEMGEKKKKMEEGEHKKKGHKGKAEKKAEKSKKEMQKKKKNEEESKKKKEYKRIKHNKGLVTKEKKTMHRDKHIKAHDRGAAKEKALKERTQIEFFEREQIVDDEFEKAKKSTMKAGWQSGHEAKKSSKEMHGDTMPAGGSHYVKHAPYAEQGSGMASESSSAKESNKFEKKNMEAKGKKFKGWREKGYKIITETEFIDRGSLHDSAYKKRDKGAAHHQKYKKQESMSEGHHGSMQEHNKKMHHKEEKKHKQHEKKDEHMKKEAKEMEKKKKKKEGGEKMEKKKKMMKKHGGDHELEESAATVEPIGEHRPLEGDLGSNSQPSSANHLLLAAPANTNFRLPVSNFMHQQNQHTPKPESLIRLLAANHDEVSDELQADLLQRRDSPAPMASNTTSEPDVSTSSPNNQRGSGSKVHNPATILDIVDNSTGNHVNKTKIGTYELEEQQPPRVRNLTSIVDNLVAKYIPSAKALSLAPKSPTSIPPRTSNHTDQSSHKTTIQHQHQSRSQAQHQQSADEKTGGGAGTKPSSLTNLMSRVDQALSREREAKNGNQQTNQQPKLRPDTNLATNGKINENFINNNNLLAPTTYNDAADRAVQLLQLIQRASQKGDGNQMQVRRPLQQAQRVDFPSPPTIQEQKQLALAQNQQQQQEILQSAYLQQQLAAVSQYRSQPGYLFTPSNSQFGYGGSSGSNIFNSDQLLDYDQDAILAQAALMTE